MSTHPLILATQKAQLLAANDPQSALDQLVGAVIAMPQVPSAEGLATHASQALAARTILALSTRLGTSAVGLDKEAFNRLIDGMDESHKRLVSADKNFCTPNPSWHNVLVRLEHSILSNHSDELLELPVLQKEAAWPLVSTRNVSEQESALLRTFLFDQQPSYATNEQLSDVLTAHQRSASELRKSVAPPPGASPQLTPWIRKGTGIFEHLLSANATYNLEQSAYAIARTGAALDATSSQAVLGTYFALMPAQHVAATATLLQSANDDPQWISYLEKQQSHAQRRSFKEPPVGKSDKLKMQQPANVQEVIDMSAALINLAQVEFASKLLSSSPLANATVETPTSSPDQTPSLVGTLTTGTPSTMPATANATNRAQLPDVETHHLPIWDQPMELITDEHFEAPILRGRSTSTPSNASNTVAPLGIKTSTRPEPSSIGLASMSIPNASNAQNDYTELRSFVQNLPTQAPSSAPKGIVGNLISRLNSALERAQDVATRPLPVKEAILVGMGVCGATLAAGAALASSGLAAASLVALGVGVGIHSIGQKLAQRYQERFMTDAFPDKTQEALLVQGGNLPTGSLPLGPLNFKERLHHPRTAALPAIHVPQTIEALAPNASVQADTGTLTPPSLEEQVLQKAGTLRERIGELRQMRQVQSTAPTQPSPNKPN